MVSATFGASAPQATAPDVTQQTTRDRVHSFREVILATPLRRYKINFRCQKFLETGSIHTLILDEGENRVTSSFCLSPDGIGLDPIWNGLDPVLKRDRNGSVPLVFTGMRSQTVFPRDSLNKTRAIQGAICLRTWENRGIRMDPAKSGLRVYWFSVGASTTTRA